MYGKAVRRARTARGLTQVELARISGIEQANISAIENGRRAPTTDTLHRLLGACGFALVASAGERTFVLPWPDEEVAVETAPPIDAPIDVPIDVRVRMLTAALDAAEAIVRSR